MKDNRFFYGVMSFGKIIADGTITMVHADIDGMRFNRVQLQQFVALLEERLAELAEGESRPQYEAEKKERSY